MDMSNEKIYGTQAGPILKPFSPPILFFEKRSRGLQNVQKPHFLARYLFTERNKTLMWDGKIDEHFQVCLVLFFVCLLKISAASSDEKIDLSDRLTRPKPKWYVAISLCMWDESFQQELQNTAQVQPPSVCTEGVTLLSLRIEVWNIWLCSRR